MSVAIVVCFVLGLPMVAFLVIRLGDSLLMARIPAYDPAATKTRTDVYSMRAAYASFIVGLLILVVWALALASLGLIAGLRLR
jgi:hypothetical protein